MIRRPLLVLLTLAAIFSAGCSLFKKSTASKPDRGLAGEVEADFKTRWVDKRAAELVAQGQSAEAARGQATTEFKERFGFTGAAQK